MKWSNCGLVLVLIFLCFGHPIESSNTSIPRCYQPEILYSYLDEAIIHYNQSYPYVDVMSVLHPVLDLMLGPGQSGFSDDLAAFWMLVCRAKDVDQEIEAWKVLTREITHRLQTDHSIYKISTLLFGDRMGGWLMKPRLKALDMDDSQALENCIHELGFHHMKHCGPLFTYGFKYLDTFDAMCRFGLKGDEYDHAAQQVCKDYVYIFHPLREPA